MRDFHYKSFSDLNSAIIRNLHKFPHDIDIVVGIPRSGMLPANLVFSRKRNEQEGPYCG